jgi:hypothetical protein
MVAAPFSFRSFIRVADRVSFEFPFRDFGFKPALLIDPIFKIQLKFIKKMACLMMTDLPLLLSGLAVMPLFQPASMAIVSR